MKKWLKNKNVWLVLVLLAASAAVLVFAGTMENPLKELPQEMMQTEQTAEPDAADSQTEEEEMPVGYILVQRNGEGGWIPLPAGESMTVRLNDEKDPDIQNVLRVTPNGFLMESSTCDNQDCVDQGEVTLENMDERVLMNMVICLPHQLSVELYSTEQLMEMGAFN